MSKSKDECGEVWSAEIHTGFPRLYTAANGRCLIKAFAISLACSVIFLKKKRWENILALGPLVLKKKLFLIITLILRGKELNHYIHIVEYDLLPCSKQYFSSHFIREYDYPFAVKA